MILIFAKKYYCDSNDTLIKDISSLKSGISLNLISNFKLNILLNEYTDNKSSCQLLDIIFENKNEIKEFYNSMEYVIKKVVACDYKTVQSSKNEDSVIKYDKLTENSQNIDNKEMNVVYATEENSRTESKVLLNVFFNKF